MAVYTTTTTFATVGTATATITPGFQALGVTIAVAPATGEDFQGVQECVGWTDGTRKMCKYIYHNPANGAAISGTTTSKLVRLYSDVSGTPTVVLEAVLNSITATQVKFDVSIASTDYQVSIKCEG